MLGFRRSLRRSLPYGVGLAATAFAFAATALPAQTAEACGCTSPPEPTALDGRDFAVNQSAEQIIFEVNDDATITAHVLIRYNGDPAAFAWIVPVPDTPSVIDLSPATAFALLDRQTRPQIFIGQESICPDPEYRCEYHEPIWCGGESSAESGWGETSSTGTTGGSDGGTGGGDPPDVNVEDQKIIGDYEVTTLSATQASELATWLQTNGYYVNDTMSPYMQPYLDAGMKFVAAKLLPGAGLDSIKPLQMTYPGTEPMIPLQLTAVAAEPHMSVVAYVYGDGIYKEKTHEMLQPDAAQLERAFGTGDARENYPMMLSRIIDEAGGDAFVREYQGPAPIAQFEDDSGCCGGGDQDFCGIGGDGSCQCPRDPFDMVDCAEIPDLLESITFLDALAVEHTRATRIITRMSPEEMSFDPTFDVDSNASADAQPLTLSHQQPTLAGCEPDIIDNAAYDEIGRKNQCAATYCGQGECGTTLEGAGCMCDENYTARMYTELDGRAAVTCVPKAHPVDLQIDPMLVDVCGDIDCGAGSCVEIGGFPTCECDAGAVAIVDETDNELRCYPNATSVGDAGAMPYSTPMRDLEVCAPAPPSCGAEGWLVENDWAENHGVLCESSMPNPEDFEIPPAPSCDEAGGESTGEPHDAGIDDGKGGCACSSDDAPAPLGLGALMLGWLGFMRRRRR